MSVHYQSEYTASKEVALNWWRSLPGKAVSVCALDENSKPCEASQPSFRPEDSSAVWFVWTEKNLKDRLMVGISPLKKSSDCWKMDISWWPSLKPVAEIVEKTLLSLGAVCTRFPVSGTK